MTLEEWRNKEGYHFEGTLRREACFDAWQAAHREGWEQAKREAGWVCDKWSSYHSDQENIAYDMGDPKYIAAHETAMAAYKKAHDDILAMEYKND